MLYSTRTWLPVIGVLLFSCSLVGAGDNELIDHPLYKFWANCKPGSTVTLVEKTTFSGAEKEQVPDGVDEKIVTRKLLSVDAKGVVVQMVVSESDFLGMIESAPTKATYAAKIKKGNLRAAQHYIDAAKGEDSVTVDGKKIACKTLAGTEKKDGTTIEHKLWFSEAVPGGIVKRTQVTTQDGKAIANTTILVKSFKHAE